MTTRRNTGALLMREKIMSARGHIENAQIDINQAFLALQAIRGDELALAVKALRTIANGTRSDDYSRGLAKAALKRIRCR